MAVPSLTIMSDGITVYQQPIRMSSTEIYDVIRTMAGHADSYDIVQQPFAVFKISFEGASDCAKDCATDCIDVVASQYLSVAEFEHAYDCWLDTMEPHELFSRIAVHGFENARIEPLQLTGYAAFRYELRFAENYWRHVLGLPLLA